MMSEMNGKLRRGIILTKLCWFSVRGTIYTKAELEKAFDRLQQEMETTVRQELEMFYRMSGKKQFMIIIMYH
jgi:hypothetical protein